MYVKYNVCRYVYNGVHGGVCLIKRLSICFIRLYIYILDRKCAEGITLLVGGFAVEQKRKRVVFWVKGFVRICSQVNTDIFS